MSSLAPIQHGSPKALLSPEVVGLLVVSANQELRRDVISRLQSPRWVVLEAPSGAGALERIDAGEASLVLLDPALPDLRVEEFREIVQMNYPAVEIVPINPHSGQPIVATPSPESVCFEIVRDLGRGGSLRSENLVTATNVFGETVENDLPGFVGKAPIVHRLCVTARLVAQRDTTVLITG
jgi:DNA-binding NtrC family response regulator